MFETIEEYIKNWKKLPENPNKKNWEKVFNSMAVHTRKAIPADLLLKRRPNEEEHVHKYRIDNYEAITYGSMNKCFDDLFRVINGVNYQIEAGDQVKKYIKDSKFYYQNESLSFELYIQKVVLKRMIEDPNGWLAWIPSGPGLTDSAQKVTPEPLLIYSNQFHYADKNLFSWKSEEKSPLKTQQGIEYSGDVYYIFTKTEYFKLFQTGSKSRPSWALELIYFHGIGKIPIITLGGDINAAGYYESFFEPYLAFGNEAIRQFSDWQAVMIASNHPIKEQFEAECEVDVISKLSNNVPELEQKFDKQVQQGRLKLRNKTASPYSVIERKVVPKNQEQYEGVLPYEIPSVRFIQPSVENARYSGESWEKLLDRAEKALNIDLTVGVDQSGIAKQMDKESQYSMLTKVGNNLFDNIFYNSIKLIDCYLNLIVYSSSTISIVKPSTFWIKNELDLITEISTLKEKNAPGFFMAQASIELAKKRFSGNPIIEKIFTFISVYDPLFIYSTDEKVNMKAAGVIDNDEFISSVYMFTMLQQIAYEQTPERFMQLQLDKIKEIYDQKISLYIEEEEEEDSNELDDSGNVIPIINQEEDQEEGDDQ